MPPKLVFKRISQAGVNGGGAGNSGGVQKPSSPKKSPTRSSNRLAGLPPDALVPPATGPTYTLRDEVKETPEGVQIAQKWVYKDGVRSELFAYYNNYKAEHFYPGQIIRATMSNYQTNTKVSLDDRNIATHTDGPVYSKKRPMVVMWKTNIGLLCLPIVSQASESSYKDGSHMWDEYVSAKAVDKEEWTTKTKWHGPSVRFVILEGHHRKTYLRDQEVYVNVAQPCYIGRQEEMDLNIGYLTGDSYARLMAAFDLRQHQQKVAAFGEYSNEKYTPANPMVVWPGDPKTAGGLQQERAAEQEKRMARFYPRLDEGLDATKLVRKFELAGTK
ncbi:hypothetical protein D6C84_04766 [Aureobasidium pullulans]|uniref:Uncharacterized protein n=1 Tax=Aureobasidium pullulans TaxID=5580 RepID=A0A4V4L134_AURPU|nr:hypothetical protein D6C84_04766 [Aureobasidium pullulans]